MMRGWALLVGLLWFPGMALASNPLAVLYFDSSGQAPELEGLKVGLAQMLISDLAGDHGVEVVERSKIQAIMDELDLGHSGMADPAAAAKVGKLVGARYMMFGSYFELMGQLQINARVVDVETSRIIGSQGASGPVADFMRLEAELAAFAKKTMKSLPTEARPAPSKPTPQPAPTIKPLPSPAPQPAAKPGTRESAVAASPEMFLPDPKALEAAQAYSQGLIFMDAGDDLKARERFQSALASKPNLAHAKSALASLEI